MAKDTPSDTGDPRIVEHIQHFLRTAYASAGAIDPAEDAAERFDELARQAFAFQWQHVEPYRRLCRSRGVEPEGITSWRDVPLVPTTAFKRLELAAAPAREVFKSSGTREGEEHRSVHHHPFPDLYRAVIDASFPRYCLPGLARPPMLSLVPDRQQLPDSSLSFMIDHVLEHYGGEGSKGAFGKRRLELTAVRSWLGARQRDGRPALILATGFALVQLLDGLDKLGLRFRLPAGSALFETGGLKGRTREVERSEVLARLEESLGLQASRVVSEYGMTELTSQCYSRALQGPLPEGWQRDAFVPPPWVRVRILDAETLEEAPAGQVGLVAIFDLANVGSAVHLLTEDLGRTVADGEGGGFHLVGRAGGAQLRGCSLVVEEMAEG